MFTGIIDHVATVTSLDRRDKSLRLTLTLKTPFTDSPAIGESISVSGACLTVVGGDPARLVFDVSEETLARTTLARADLGLAVNIERALTPQSRLGGHYVTGHVDVVGRVVRIHTNAEGFWNVALELPWQARPFCAPKGSLAVDGVSLTVNSVEAHGKTVRIGMTWIPHTLQQTTLQYLRVGDMVNVEYDLIARYVVSATQT
jgi:riboflavin synthase